MLPVSRQRFATTLRQAATATDGGATNRAGSNGRGDDNADEADRGGDGGSCGDRQSWPTPASRTSRCNSDTTTAAAPACDTPHAHRTRIKLNNHRQAN